MENTWSRWYIWILVLKIHVYLLISRPPSSKEIPIKEPLPTTIDNMPTYDVKKTQHGLRRRAITCMLWSVFRRKERMPQGNKRNIWFTVHCIDWLHKGLYGSSILDNRFSENVQDIRQSHKIHYRNHEKLESRIDSKKINVSRGENLERYLPGSCVFAITILNSNGATQLNT